MSIAKSFKIGSKTFSIIKEKGNTYLNDILVESPHALKTILISNAENPQDATMVADILSLYPSRGNGNIFYSNKTGS